MHFGKVTILGLLLWLLVLADKYVFFELLGFTAAWQSWIYYILLIIFARIISRRLGVINFLEAIFSALVWLLTILVLDSLLAKAVLSAAAFSSPHYWWSYAAILIAVFFLHKKRHIQVRKLLHEKHHGHGYH